MWILDYGALRSWLLPQRPQLGSIHDAGTVRIRVAPCGSGGHGIGETTGQLGALPSLEQAMQAVASGGARKGWCGDLEGATKGGASDRAKTDPHSLSFGLPADGAGSVAVIAAVTVAEDVSGAGAMPPESATAAAHCWNSCCWYCCCWWCCCCSPHFLTNSPRNMWSYRSNSYHSCCCYCCCCDCCHSDCCCSGAGCWRCCCCDCGAAGAGAFGGQQRRPRQRSTTKVTAWTGEWCWAVMTTRTPRRRFWHRGNVGHVAQAATPSVVECCTWSRRSCSALGDEDDDGSRKGQNGGINIVRIYLFQNALTNNAEETINELIMQKVWQ